MTTLASINGLEPITTAEAKDHCYVTGSDWDTYIDTLITAAREYAENRTWRAIIDATYELRLDDFPDGEIQLPKPPARAVDSISYIDSDGNQQTLANSEYEVDTENEYGRVRPKSSWPSTDDVYNAVTIMFTAGYDGNAAKYELPKQIKQGMLMLIKHLFDNREMVVVSEGRTLDAKEVPVATNVLLDMYSARTFA